MKKILFYSGIILIILALVWHFGFNVKLGGRTISVKTDNLTDSAVTMDYSEARVHAGYGYTLSTSTVIDTFDTGTSSAIAYWITAPASTTARVHLSVVGTANTAAYFEIFEDTGSTTEFFVSGGNPVTPINRNRNSSNTSSLTASTTPDYGNSVPAAATLLYTGAVGRSTADRGTNQFLLKDSTQYLIRASTYATDNEGVVEINWYEVPN